MDPRGAGSSARATNLVLLEAYVRRDDIDVLTLDVFDTLLMRRVARPVDAFAVLGAQLRADGLLASGLDPATFARLRRDAELRARRVATEAGRGPEIRLADIYGAMPITVTSAPECSLEERELRVEHALTFPDPAIVAVARAAHAGGKRVALVSDTYFSPAQLDYLLAGALRDVPLRIFTSSEFGVGKAGGLFDAVLDHLDVEAQRVVHAGDNEVADVERPAELGIHAVHLTREDPELERMLRTEGFVLDDALDDAVAPRTFDWADGDFGLSAVRLRALAAVDGDDETAPYRRVGASILGPVFTGFAEWVVREAQELEARRVYCLMREGAFLTPFVQEVADSLGAPIEARPLWLSRAVAAKAAITTVDETTIRSFLVRRRTPTPRALADALGVPARLLAPRGSLDTPLDDALLANRVVLRIVGDSEVRDAVAASAAAARARLARYLERACEPEDREILLVDLGWNGTIQAGFDAALAAMGEGRTTHGRYLATTRHITALLLDGMRARGFLVNAGTPAGDATALIRSPEVLEMVTLPAEGSLVDYTEAGEPVLADRPVSEAQLAQEAAVREGIRAFASLWGRCRPADVGAGLASDDGQLRMIARRFVARPTTSEFALFASWAHEDNFGSDGTDRLDHVDPALDLRYVAASELYRFPNEAVYWPAGVVAEIAPRLAVGADLVLDGFAPETVGDHPVPGFVVELEFDSPAVKSPAWADAARLVANPERRCLAQLITIIPNPTAIRLRFRGGAALAVDRIRTVLHRRKGEPAVVDVDDVADAWPSERGAWRGTRLCPDGSGEAVVALAGRHLPDGEVYRTEVTLYLRLVDDEVPAP